MEWNIQNARKREAQENPDTSLDFSKYQIQKPKRVNPSYDLRLVMAEMTGKTIGHILKETKGWSYGQLAGCVEDSKHNGLKFKNNGGARCNNIIKEVNQKKK